MTENNILFIAWLNKKLIELKTDPDVFGNYIAGILSEDETREEKCEGLKELLSEIIETDLQNIVTEILNKWEECNQQATTPLESKPPPIDIDAQFAKLLADTQKQSFVPVRKHTVEDSELKKQILAQYAEIEVAECDDFDGPETTQPATQAIKGLEPNRNVEDVIQIQKEKREQARMDSAAKKQKDKEDREKQKQLREEKKEKRKTVKVERRR